MITSDTPANEHIAVPLLDLKAQYATIADELHTALDRVVEAQYFILGPEVVALEEEVAAYSQCAYGIGVSSGTDALLVSLMAIDIKPGDEVITTTFTFIATAAAAEPLAVEFADFPIDRSDPRSNPLCERYPFYQGLPHPRKLQQPLLLPLMLASGPLAVLEGSAYARCIPHPPLPPYRVPQEC